MSEASKAADSDDPSALSFGDALEKLQGVVEQMESDELPLETLLTRYEEGMRLARVCEAKLASAELRIQQLEQTVAGEPRLRPFVPTQAESSDSE